MKMLDDHWLAGSAVWRRWGGDSVARLLGRSGRRPRGGRWQPATRPIGEQRGLVASELDRLGRPELAAELAALPEHFLLARPPESVATHLLLAAEPLAAGQVRTRARGMAPGVWELFVVARDQPGLLATMAGVLDLRGMSVLSAAAATRDDGVALDAFAVVPSVADGWGAIANDLAATLSGQRPLEEWLAQHRALGEAGAPLAVAFANDRSPYDSVLEVRGPDRRGLLYRIAGEIYALELDIRSAEIETLPSGVVDTFYVRTIDGARLDDARGAAIARALAERLAAAALGQA